MARSYLLTVLGVLSVVAMACSEGSRDDSSQGGRSAGGRSTASGGEPSAGASSDSVGGVAGARAGSTSGGTTSVGTAGATGCPAPIDLGVRFVGRYDGCVANAVRFAWSGSGFVARFSGTGLSVQLRGQTNQFTVIVDGVLQPKLVTDNNVDKSYTLATGLAAGEHVVQFYRRTEANQGATSVVAVAVESGQLLAPPAAPERLIEVVGDSISCGYGNEGTIPCGFTPDTENHYLSYGALLARSLGAELSTVAWSGKGVVINYNGDGNEIIPVVYDRVVPTEKRSLWNFVPQPQLVLINLGTNDFSGSWDPTEATFVAGYQALLAKIRGKYPGAYILCTNGPMLAGTDLSAKARPFIAEAVAARRAAGDINVEAYEMTTPNTNPACDSHPNLLTHQAMATELETKVRAVLGW